MTKKGLTLNVRPFMFGAGGQTRTGTPVKAADFESAASTNSATPAMEANYTQIARQVNHIADFIDLKRYPRRLV